MGTVSRVHTFASGAILTAAQLNNEFDNLLTSSAINGGLDATNLGVTAGQATASKALVVDASRNLADATGSNRINNLALSGTFESTGAVTASAGITSGGNIVSDTDSTDDLGTTGVRWANLFVDDVTVTNNVTIGGTLTLTGGITLNGNTTIGDSSADTLTVNSTITSNLIFTDATYDIGASGATRPRDLFLSRNAVMGGTLGVTGLITATGGVSGALTGDVTGNVTGGTISGTTGTFSGDVAVGTDKLFVDVSASRVGINTSSPQAPLNAVSAYSSGTTTTSLKLATVGGYDSGSGTSIDFGQDQTNYSTWLTGKIASPRTGTNWGGSLVFYTNDNSAATGIVERLRLTHDGNMGLGVTPSAWSGRRALEIEGASTGYVTSPNGPIAIGSNIYYNGGDKFVGNGYAPLYALSSGNHIWYTSNNNTSGAGAAVTLTQAMTLTNAGNLGLGTASPTTFAGYTTLHHKNSSGDVVQLAENDNGVIHQIIASGTDTVLLGTRSNHDLKLCTNDTERARITSGGQFIVGANGYGGDAFNISNGGAEQLEVGTASGDAIFQSFNRSTSAYIPTEFRASEIRFDTGSSPTERLRIDSSGAFLVNKTSATGIPGNLTYGTIEVQQIASRNAFITTGMASGNVAFGTSSSASHNYYAGYFYQYNGSTYTGVGNIAVGTTSTSYNTTSDYRLKENIVGITDGITRIKSLKPSRFNFIAEADRTVDGFLAHEVSDIVPEAISGAKDAVDEEGNPEYQGIDQSKLVPLLTAALQEAITKIETLETKVAALEAA